MLKTDRNKTIMLCIVMMLGLIGLARAGSLTYYDSTQNSGQITTKVTEYKATCNSAPTSRLGLCNNTCLTCVANDPSKCDTCDEGYYRDGTFCMINQTNYKYSNITYVGVGLAEALSTVASFRYTSSNASLTSNMVISICSSTYEIEALGIFQSTDIINLQFFREDPIDQIQIKLNFASLVSSISFYITLNDNILFSKNFGNLADLVGSYVQNSNTSERSFLSLNSLSSTTASSIFLPVDTTLTKYITSTYTIKFYIKTESNEKYTWMFNDVIIFQRDCQTCVSKAVQALMQSTSLAVAFTILVVFALIIILCIAMAYEEIRRKMEFQQKLGTSSGNLPIKAIDRVMEAVVRARKVRDKQINKEYRECQKAIKHNFPQQGEEQSRVSRAINKVDSLNPVKQE